MAENTSYFGDIIAGIGNVTEPTLGLLTSARINENYLKEQQLAHADLEKNRQAQFLLGQGRLEAELARVALEAERLKRTGGRPIIAAPGSDVLDPNDPTRVLHTTPTKPPAEKFPPRPGGGWELVDGEWKYTGVGTADKNALTEYQRQRLALERERLRAAKAKEAEASGEQFSKWSPEDKQFWFEYVAQGNQPPRFAWGDRKSYTEFNKEYARWQTGRGVSGGEAGAEKVDLAAKTSGLRMAQQRETAIRIFTNRIDRNIGIIRQLQEKYGQNEFGRLLNVAQNNIRQGIAGSGDLASLQLALVSTSNEIAKVESGSLGMGEVSVTQAERMAKIHDPNMNAADLSTVLDTSLNLSKTATESVREEVQLLKQQIRELGSKQSSAPYKPVISPATRQSATPAPTRTKVIAGKTYYQLSNGKWDDTPPNATSLLK